MTGPLKERGDQTGPRTLGRVALVGGASAGIGFAVARVLARHGARVALVSRSPERIGAAARRIQAEGGTALAVTADLTDPEAPGRVVREVEAALGPVEILVTNAGGPPAMPATATTASDLEAAMRLLLLPVQRLLALTLPGMRARRWGRVVAITSIAVREPQPGLVLSNALRAGLTGYLKTVADEVAADGVTVNSVLPGYTATERLRELATEVAARRGTDPEVVLAEWAEGNPVGRLLEPEEIAAAVVFLASEAASGITGVALPVDGGRGRFLL